MRQTNKIKKYINSNYFEYFVQKPWFLDCKNISYKLLHIKIN